MIAIPAIDIRDGCCVQLVGGDFADERVRLPDPVAVARQWIDAGFRRLHVVDLDAAVRGIANDDAIDALTALEGIEMQVGGGIRTTEQVERLLRAGARRVVAGTRAIDDPNWLRETARAWPDRIVVAADAREGRVVADGWTSPRDAGVLDVVAEYGALPLGGFLVTAVDREGRMGGPDVSLIEKVVRATTLPVIASGGIGSMRDLEDLSSCGAAGAVIGMALYTGALDPRAVSRTFNE